LPAPLGELFDRLPEAMAREAFSHPSWLGEDSNAYERLAFLGDSVLNISVSTSLFPRYGDSSAGRLTKIRAQAVSRRSCVEVAKALDVPQRMGQLIPDDQRQQAELIMQAGSVLAETLEAGIGACYLEYGYERTTQAVADAFAEQIDEAAETQFDFKSDLQERLAQTGRLVTYSVISEEGPPHSKLFESIAQVDGAEIGRGSGASKKASEQQAARAALEMIEEDPD
jgi:ribonuclease-3